MSKLQAAAWNRCWTPRVFRTAYRLDVMLAEAGGSLTLRAEQIRGLADRVRTDAAARELEDACIALGVDYRPHPDGSSWAIARKPGAMGQAARA